MADIYKHGNENFKKITFLFVLQVILGVAPVVLLVLYIVLKLYTNALIGYVFIGIIFLCAVFNIIAAKRYNVLISGFRGEKSVIRFVKRLDKSYTVFTNIPIRYKKNRSEIDMLILCSEYIVILEVKNHSGNIYGNHTDEYWTQRKIYRDGKIAEIRMQNPLKQLRRQRDIFKSILRANDLDHWVETVLYFSNKQASLYLDLYDNDNVLAGERELADFLRTCSRRNIPPEKLTAIKELLKDMSKK